MDHWFRTMLTLWRLGYLDHEDQDPASEEAAAGDDEDADPDDDLPPWFKPPYWPPGSS